MVRLMDSKNLTVWLSLGIAMIALVLSQLPPIPRYFALPKLDVTAHRNLQVRHYLGDLVLVPFLQINNSGKAQGAITKIELVLTKQDDPSFRKNLLAQAYYLKPETIALNQTPTAIPFGHISVPPSETWETYIDFYEPPSAARRLRAADIQGRVAAEIQESLADKSPLNNELAEISNELFDEIRAHTDKRLSSFEIGEYRLYLRLFGESESEPAARRCYSLTVFEGHLSRFDAITEHYRFGAGITFPLPGQAGFLGDLFDVECTTYTGQRSPNKVLQPTANLGQPATRLIRG